MSENCTNHIIQVDGNISVVTTDTARSSKNILENIVLLTISGAERDTQPELGVGLAA